ncbi:hypothetical protein, partial [Yoonia sp.]|uniref:hypothetical protein n=1 Tax=Yoonia sp. TaxID=2212373 RepID=UPI0040488DA0
SNSSARRIPARRWVTFWAPRSSATNPVSTVQISPATRNCGGVFVCAGCESVWAGALRHHGFAPFWRKIAKLPCKFRRFAAKNSKSCESDAFRIGSLFL